MANVIPPLEVIKALNEAGVNFILVGAHGLGGWTKMPRATQDVDVIVAARHQKKAIHALLAAFPNLELQDLPVVAWLRDRETQQVAIAVMKADQQLYRSAFQHTTNVRSGEQAYKIPSLEMALAMKFAPMVSLHREDADKYLDAHDFMYMLKSNPEIDLDTLAELGDLVYPGGGAEVLELVRRTKAGEKLNL